MQKVLPDVQRLVQLRDQGMTYKEIAAWLLEHEHVKVSPGSVGAALSRAGVTAGRARHLNHLPWLVHREHLTHYAARMLRSLGRRDAGKSLGVQDEKRLDAWLGKLRAEGKLVTYRPEEGFLYVDGEWPVDDIPIVRAGLSKGRRKS